MAAAIALTVGFYTLAVLIAAALLALAILPWALGGAGNIWLSLGSLGLGLTILVAVFPRRIRFEPVGVRVTAAEQPRLVSTIDEEARATGARGPDEVYATLDANASVMQRRGRRVMFIGIPLLHLLSERGIRSVIAHEFGHYAGGDVRSGPWIARTYDGIARTIDHLTDDHVEEPWTLRVVRRPFVWYGSAFMRITAAILRREEFAADAAAARRVGRDAYVAALQRIHAYAPAFDAYWEHEVITVLQSGRRPPVLSGFGTYLRSSAIERLAGEHLEQRRQAVTDRYDSHPSLGERIGALDRLPPGDPDDSPPATALLRDPTRLEQDLLAELVAPEAAELPTLAWDDAAREVYLERAQALADRHGEVLGAATVGELADIVGDLGRVIGRLQQREPELTVEAAPHFAAALLTEALLVALVREGWTVEAGLGEPISVRRGDACIEPYAVVWQLRGDDVAAAGWRQRATELGIAALRLHEPGTNEGPGSTPGAFAQLAGREPPRAV
jgi:heat shock protein HtpX